MEMSEIIQRENPFEALCSLASREHWCWKIYCTTCGHMLFRYALRQLASGKSPDDEGWLVHDLIAESEHSLHELGPRPIWPFPIEEQETLSKILSTANIRLIASTCTFPDWLGYLGLGLHYTEFAERQSRAITSTWVVQLLKLVHRGSSAAHMLERLAQTPANVLGWHDLELVERDFSKRSLLAFEFEQAKRAKTPVSQFLSYVRILEGLYESSGAKKGLRSICLESSELRDIYQGLGNTMPYERLIGRLMIARHQCHHLTRHSDFENPLINPEIECWLKPLLPILESMISCSIDQLGAG